jgi:hypothetical protein
MDSSTLSFTTQKHCRVICSLFLTLLIEKVRAQGDCSILHAWLPDIEIDCCRQKRGITCVEDRVTEISYSGISNKGSKSGFNRFSGPIPERIGQLSKLERLRIYNHLLTGPIAQSFAKLNSLVVLNLSSHQLSGPIPEFIGFLSSLAVIELQKNTFTGRIPESIGELTHLKRLDLCNNVLSGRIPESIGFVSSLKKTFSNLIHRIVL